MKKLAIIYGSPRTGTSFLHECLCGHRSCAGSDKTSEPESKYGIPQNVENILQEMIDMLWAEQWGEAQDLRPDSFPVGKYLVMKSPGFCREDECKALKELVGYDCKFIHTDRSPASVIDSMLLHEISRNVLGIVIEGTDCSERFLSLYKPLWDKVGDDEVGLINRGFMRYLWHVKDILPQQLKESLVLRYEDRVKHIAVSKKIEKYLEIPHDGEFQKKMREFDYREPSTDRIKFIEDSIIPELIRDFGHIQKKSLNG